MSGHVARQPAGEPARSNDLPEDSNGLRTQLIDTARAAGAGGLVVNTSGNASVRCRRGPRPGFLLTPTGLPSGDIDRDDIVFVDVDGRVVGRRQPSSEWPFHAAIYRHRDDVDAIVHTHSPKATALSCHRVPIPPFHYMVAAAGGPDIRCAEYATFGTQALADHALEALRDRLACLLANHGVIACGGSLAAALALAFEVENLSNMYVTARALGEPHLLDADEMARVLERFRSYGQPRTD